MIIHTFGYSGLHAKICWFNQDLWALGTSSFCRSLPGFHATAGCGYNLSFFKRGKQRPFQILKKSRLSACVSQIRRRRIIWWWRRWTKSIRYSTEIHLWRIKCCRNSWCGCCQASAFHQHVYSLSFNLKTARNFDASNVPLCKSELLQQIRRANYIASIWNYARNIQEFQVQRVMRGHWNRASILTGSMEINYQVLSS